MKNSHDKYPTRQTGILPPDAGETVCHLSSRTHSFRCCPAMSA